MKKLSFLALAVAGMLLAACSSSDNVADEAQNPLNGVGKGYFKVSLNLPTNIVSSTRAAGDGWDESTNLNDGLPKEYDVNSVLLLIFEGANEGAATLQQVITPVAAAFDGVTDTPNQITANKEYVAKLNNAPTSNLYALAVINGTGIIEAGSDATKVKINGGADASGITLSDLQVATSNAMITSDKFFMTNAVLSTVRGGANNPSAAPTLQILAPIKPEYIYETEAAATAGVAATDIYVERGVAKVTLTQTLSAAALTMKDGSGVTPSFEGWVLDNTENTSYIVRKVPSTFTWNLTSNQTITTDKYRFVGGNAVDKFYGTENLFRTYWAEDPNYTNDATGKTTTTTPVFPAKTAVGDDYPQYCHENTFDVAHQTHKNTTRVIVKVDLNSSGDFYTIGADRKTLYTLNDVKDLVKADLMEQSAFATWWASQSSTALTGAGLTVTFSSTDAGVVTVTDITIAKDAFTPAKAADVNVSTITGGTAMLTTLNNTQLAKVEYFKGGISYYEVRVKHFGDELTPWNSSEYTTPKPATGDVDAIYPSTPGRDANYLGRYGMVRNNWYDIQLGAILKVGSSTVPTVPGDDTPDDELDELYIKARINILSWAKRVQSWTLK